jgi:hypothetical protein
MDISLTPEEIARSIDTSRFPAILTPVQAAELLQIAITTLYRQVSEGAFRSAVRRGKPLRFWRDRLVIIFLSGASSTPRPGRTKPARKSPPIPGPGSNPLAL